MLWRNRFVKQLFWRHVYRTLSIRAALFSVDTGTPIKNNGLIEYLETCINAGTTTIGWRLIAQVELFERLIWLNCHDFSGG